MLWSLLLILTLASVPVSSGSGLGCEQRVQGCRIQRGMCVCGIGCPSDYIYSNKEECRTALKGRKSDECQRSPCLNGGACSQTTQSPGYRCRCEGTGFYGSRCQNGCPRPGSSGLQLPFECILI